MCFIWVETSNREALATAHREHWALLHMIKEKDAKGAAALIRTHIDRAQESLVEVLQAHDDVRNAVLAAMPSKIRGSDQQVPDIETQQGGTL